MNAAQRDAKLQAALEALRDSMARVGHAWMTRRRDRSIRGVLRMTIGLEPVYAPITEGALLVALAAHGIRPRSTRPQAGIDLRVIHRRSGVEIDLAIAAEMSKRTRTHFDRMLGRGWRKRPPDT